MSSSDEDMIPRSRTHKSNKRKAAVVDESDGEAELHVASTAAASQSAEVDDAEAEIARYDDTGMGDEDDQAYLESLTNLQREEILYERQERRQALIERRDARLRQESVAAQDAANKQKAERKATRASTASKRTPANDKAAALADITARRTGRARRVEADQDDEAEPSAEPSQDEASDAYENASDDYRSKRRKKAKTSSRPSRRSDRETESQSRSVSEADDDALADEESDEYEHDDDDARYESEDSGGFARCARTLRAMQSSAAVVQCERRRSEREQPRFARRSSSTTCSALNSDA